MAHNLVRNLPDSYIQYELLCRHVNVSTISCRDRKKLLAKFLYDEREQVSTRFNSYLPADKDCAEVHRLFDKLNTEVNSESFSRGEYVLDCLIFLRVRISRIFPIDPSIKAKLEQLVVNIDKLEQQLEDTVVDLGDQLSELSFSLENTPGNPTMLVNHSVTKQPATFNPSVLVNQSHNRLKVPVHKWGIKFSGEKGTLSPMDFINRISDYQSSKHVTDEELFLSFSDLLEGTAYTWFRSLRNLGFAAPKTWAELRGKLLQDFEKNMTDFMFDLEHSIRQCQQTEDTTVISFFALIEEKFVQLSTFKQISQDEQIRIIRRNLLPSFKEALTFQVFQTVDELKKACKRIEDIRSQNSISLSKEVVKDVPSNEQKHVTFTSDYLPGTNFGHSPSFGQQQTNSKRTTPNPFSRQIFSDHRLPSQSHENKGAVPKTNRPDINSIVCFKCGLKGHYANKCSKSGNFSGSWRTGSSTAPIERTDPQ